MTITTFFSSTSNEQKWVDQIGKKFIKEVAIDISIQNPICIFNIPNTITIFKPEAYLPQVIALGPYHHMDPHLYHMERYKISCARSSFNQSPYGHGNVEFREILITRLKELDLVVRSCYHSYIDLDDDTLSWIMAIDGLFLVNLLQGCLVDPGNTIVSRDLLLLENQIPFVVLKEIYTTLKLDSNDSASEEHPDAESQLLFMMESFCRTNSPLKLSPSSSRSYKDISHLHLLDLMYHLMINNGFPQSERSSHQDEESSGSRNSSEQTEFVEDDINSACDNIGLITKIATQFGIGRKILKPVQVIQDIKWDKILTISGIKANKNPKTDEQYPTVEEIKIPSVHSLYHYAGIAFRPTTEGITGIDFVEQEAALYLPVITLDVNSEVILRNLVAYEIATNNSNSSVSFSQFVDLLSGIIDNSEDVRLLKEKGIIKGGLTNDETAELFNGMNKTSRRYRDKTVLKINKYYKKKLVVRMFKFVKRRWVTLLKVMTYVLNVLLLVVLVLYSFCEFYGCPKLFGGKS